MTRAVSPELMELARAHLEGRVGRDRLETALRHWNQDHPESIWTLEQLIALAQEDGESTRIATGSPGTRESSTRLAGASPQTGEEEATRVISATFPSVPTDSDEGETRVLSASDTARTAGDDAEPAPSAKELQPGDRLKDRFILESLLGRGGMGAVFKALDLRKQEAQDRDPYLAVKVLSGDFREHPAAFIALQREAKKAQKLAHPNTVTVFDFDRDGSIVYMTMELLEGESLKDLLKSHPYGMPFKEVLPVVEGIVSGLSYAHEKGIVHSDLKPGNIFITKEGTVKVLDFGIARALHGSRLHEGDAVRSRAVQATVATSEDATLFDPAALGALTPTYASCEMLEGKDPDPRDDVYALACVTYELLTGRHPFQRLPATEARDRGMKPEPVTRIPRRAWRAIQHGLAFDREERTPSAQQFFIELSGRKPGQGVNPRIVALVVVLVLASGVGLTLHFQPQLEYLWHQMFPTELPPEKRAEIEDLLELADLNRETGRLVSPPGSNAYEAYQAVLEIDPWNRRARKGLDKIADYLLAEANRLYSTEQVDKARALVEESLRYFPEHKGLRKLQKRLEKETPRS